MVKKSITFIITLLVIGTMVFTSCKGKTSSNNSNDSGTSVPSSTSGNSNNVGNNDNLFDISKDKITISANLDEAQVFSEIPTEFFKGVGELRGTGADSSGIFRYQFSGWKYSVQFRFHVKSGENAAKTLVDYYKSIGGTVREIGLRSNFAEVTFDWGESVEIAYSSFEGQDSVRVQFNVVKE